MSTFAKECKQKRCDEQPCVPAMCTTPQVALHIVWLCFFVVKKKKKKRPKHYTISPSYAKHKIAFFIVPYSSQINDLLDL